MYNSQEKLAIYLNIFDFLSLKKQHDLFDKYQDIDNFANRIGSDKDFLLKLVSQDEYDKMVYELDDVLLDNYIANLTKQGITVCTYASDTYPLTLANTASPPMVLYCKGDLSLLKSLCVAVVGTRRVSKYGKEITHKFAFDMAYAGITIVSGLADGVDSIAHKACLDAGGKTIAVLGGGFNNLYPASNVPLANEILQKGGLIITEYKPSMAPASFTFPARNRIIAGLSRGVLITEATLKSGSMHTKEYALENGRDVFAVPGRITDIYSEGCNQIIKNCQTTMVLSPDEIINLYGKQTTNMFDSENQIQLSFDEQIVMDIIDVDEVHYDEILAKSGMTSKVLNTLLMKMELTGKIKKLPGNYYCK